MVGQLTREKLRRSDVLTAALPPDVGTAAWRGLTLPSVPLGLALSLADLIEKRVVVGRHDCTASASDFMSRATADVALVVDSLTLLRRGSSAFPTRL